MKKVKYLNVWEELITAFPFCYFIFVIAGRGVGKTYSVLKSSIDDFNAKFIYVRRTEAELEMCCSKEMNPYKAINDDFKKDIQILSDGKINTINDMTGDVPKQLGIAGALTTFGKVRGTDFSDYDYIIFDEFMNTAAINRIKPDKEFTLFMNMIETVNRNRELKGKPSVKIICLGNANNIKDSGILSGLKLGEVIRQMKYNHEDIYVDQERLLLISLPECSSVAEAKKETALYKLSKGTEYYDMAINNEFTNDNFNVVKQLKMKQLTPICRYDDISFYNVKGNNDIMYVNRIKNDSNQFDKHTHEPFMQSYGMLIGYYKNMNKLRYSDYDLKTEVESIFKK